MRIQVQVITTSKEVKPTSKGSYTVLTVVYKDLGQNKVGEKKLMSFKEKSVFDAFAQSKSGDIFTVTMEEGEKYWEWTAVSNAPPNSNPAGSAGTTPLAATPTKSAGTWETPEERAIKQVYIIKQSSISNAVAVLTCGAKSPPSFNDIVALAEQFKDYVLDTGATSNQVNPGVKVMMSDVPDDLPA